MFEIIKKYTHTYSYIQNEEIFKKNNSNCFKIVINLY